MAFCSPAVEIVTVAWIQSRDENEGLKNAMFTKNSSSGVMICTSDVESVSTTPECTSRPKPAPTSTAPLVTPNTDMLIANN